uniref:Uncharacterized protein n=1 Tax=Rhizophora mucronata TaxID=61149 RepID=A0A2P2QYF0_RHIMU
MFKSNMCSTEVYPFCTAIITAVQLGYALQKT